LILNPSCKLSIEEIPKSPNHDKCVELRDSDIAFSRFVIINKNLFEGKTVLVVSAGTGIVGISVCKWTKAKQVIITDSS
jgi:predicted nicotinamide N-methyase